MKLDHYRITTGKNFVLSQHKTNDTGDFKDKSAAKAKMHKNIEKMKILQEKLYADNKYSLLLIFQAMDAAGKDSTIEHVMSGVNPQGCQVYSFKQPSQEEQDHSFLWRCMKREPQRGRIGIFNRSYYEEVLVVKVHNLLEKSQLPQNLIDEDIWQRRFRDINNYEQYLADNGVKVLKFFLHVSKDEQKRRFMKRINRADKNWKFSAADVAERAYWDAYQEAYQQAIKSTASKHAPWHVIPADHKWYMRYLVSSIIVDTLEELDLKFPVLSKSEMKRLKDAKIQLEKE